MVWCTISNYSAHVKIDFIRFHNSAWLLVKVILVSILTNLKNCSIAIFLRFVKDLQSNKQAFSILGH